MENEVRLRPTRLLRVAGVSMAILLVLCLPAPLLEKDVTNTDALVSLLFLGAFVLPGAGYFWLKAFEEVVVTADGVTRNNPFWSKTWGWAEIDGASLGQWAGIVPQLDLTNGSQRSFYPLQRFDPTAFEPFVTAVERGVSDQRLRDKHDS